jgi:hypothetical protein
MQFTVDETVFYFAGLLRQHLQRHPNAPFYIIDSPYAETFENWRNSNEAYRTAVHQRLSHLFGTAITLIFYQKGERRRIAIVISDRTQKMARVIGGIALMDAMIDDVFNGKGVSRKIGKLETKKQEEAYLSGLPKIDLPEIDAPAVAEPKGSEKETKETKDEKKENELREDKPGHSTPREVYEVIDDSPVSSPTSPKTKKRKGVGSQTRKSPSGSESESGSEGARRRKGKATKKHPLEKGPGSPSKVTRKSPNKKAFLDYLPELLKEWFYDGRAAYIVRVQSDIDAWRGQSKEQMDAKMIEINEAVNTYVRKTPLEVIVVMGDAIVFTTKFRKDKAEELELCIPMEFLNASESYPSIEGSRPNTKKMVVYLNEIIEHEGEPETPQEVYVAPKAPTNGWVSVLTEEQKAILSSNDPQTQNYKDAIELLETNPTFVMKPPGVSVSAFGLAMKIRSKWKQSLPKPEPPANDFFEVPNTSVERAHMSKKFMKDYTEAQQVVEKIRKELSDLYATTDELFQAARSPYLDAATRHSMLNAAREAQTNRDEVQAAFLTDPRVHHLEMLHGRYLSMDTRSMHNLMRGPLHTTRNHINLDTVEETALSKISERHEIPKIMETSSGKVNIEPKHHRDIVVIKHPTHRTNPYIVTTRTRLLNETLTTHLNGEMISMGMSPVSYILFECKQPPGAKKHPLVDPTSKDDPATAPWNFDQIDVTRPFLNLNGFNPAAPFDRIMIPLSQVKSIIHSDGNFYLLQNSGEMAYATANYAYAKFTATPILSQSHCQRGTFFEKWDVAELTNVSLI